MPPIALAAIALAWAAPLWVSLALIYVHPVLALVFLDRELRSRRIVWHGHYRTALARSLGAEHDPAGALVVDAHGQTTVKGLYAAGDIVRGIDQIVVAMGHAAIAATRIHNRCEIPIEGEEED